jgi:hypothetical protein
MTECGWPHCDLSSPGLTGRSSNHRPGLLDCPVKPPIKSGEGNDTVCAAAAEFDHRSDATTLLKQLQIDGLAHRPVAGVVGMEVVSTVIGRRNGAGMGWIRNNAIEVGVIPDACRRAARLKKNRSSVRPTPHRTTESTI